MNGASQISETSMGYIVKERIIYSDFNNMVLNIIGERKYKMKPYTLMNMKESKTYQIEYPTGTMDISLGLMLHMELKIIIKYTSNGKVFYNSTIIFDNYKKDDGSDNNISDVIESNIRNIEMMIDNKLFPMC